MGVQAEPDIGADSLPHELDRSHVIPGPQGGAIFVCSKPEGCNLCSFSGIFLRGLIHSSASVETKPVLDASPEEFRCAATLIFAENVMKGDIDGSVSKEKFTLALCLYMGVESLYVCGGLTDKEFTKFAIDFMGHWLGGGPGTISGEPVGGCDLYDQGVALVDGSDSSLERKDHRFRHRAGE